MKTVFSKIALSCGALILSILATGTAHADIVYLGPAVVQPSGQGVVPTVLTLQRQPAGPTDGTESGAVIRQNGQDVLQGDAKPGINSKTILFTDLRNAGVQSAADLGIFLDIVEPGNDNLLTIEGKGSLVLTAYKNNGDVLGSFAYSGEFRELTATPGPGGGRSDHAFGLDASQAATLQGFINGNSDLRLGLAATLGSARGGPDQFFFGSRGAQPIPEPATMLLLGTGLAGIAAKARKRRKQSRENAEE